MQKIIFLTCLFFLFYFAKGQYFEFGLGQTKFQILNRNNFLEITPQFSNSTFKMQEYYLLNNRAYIGYSIAKNNYRIVVNALIESNSIQFQLQPFRGDEVMKRLVVWKQCASGITFSRKIAERNKTNAFADLGTNYSFFWRKTIQTRNIYYPGSMGSVTDNKESFSFSITDKYLSHISVRASLTTIFPLHAGSKLSFSLGLESPLHKMYRFNWYWDNTLITSNSFSNPLFFYSINFLFPSFKKAG